MDKILAPNLKKIFIFFILILNLVFFYLIFNLKLGLIYKISLLLVTFIFFLSFLTIFELISSLEASLVFWLLISSISSYLFYFWSGLIIFILVLLKLIPKNNLLNSSIKIPFYQLVSQNYRLLILAFILTISLLSYRKLINTQSFPLSFENYEKFFNFFEQKFNFNLDQYIQNLLENELKKQNIVLDQKIIQQFLLPQEKPEKIIYNFLVQGWQNQKIKLLLISTFIFFLFSFVYPLLNLIAPIFVISVLLLIYLYKASGLFKINYQDIKKEIIEI